MPGEILDISIKLFALLDRDQELRRKAKEYRGDDYGDGDGQNERTSNAVGDPPAALGARRRP